MDFKENWREFDGNDALGKAVWGAIPSEKRVGWLAELLPELAKYCPVFLSEEMDLVLTLCADPNRWQEARSLFERVRRIGLAGSTHPLVDVLELSSKIIFNESGLPAPFDADVGALIVPKVAAVINHLEKSQPMNSDMVRRIESALFRRPKHIRRT